MNVRTASGSWVLAVGLAALAGCGGGGGNAPAGPSEPPPVTPPSLVGPLKDAVIDGTVYATAVAPDGTVYVGGSFDRIGPGTGSWIAVDATTGARAFDSPVVNGAVEVSAPDGAGGMFIAGRFTHVGGVRRDHLAHLLADGSLDPDWVVTVWAVDGGGKPYATTPIAMSYSAIDHRLYLGGSFSSVNGTPRANLASVTSAGALTSWDPGSNGLVEAVLAHSDGNVYVAGAFSLVGGASRANLAAIDHLGDATAWDPSPNNYVTALAAYGNTLFVQGFFTGFACSPMTPVARLAALQLDAAIVQNWNPDPNSPGFRGGDPLVVSGDTLYVGGSFTQIAGATRSGAAAFDLTTMSPASPPALEAWNPNITAATGGPWIIGFATRGQDVYVLGTFSAVDGQPRPGLAAVNATTGAVTPWNPNGGGYTAEVRGGTVWVGAWPEYEVRHNLASFGPDGELTSWDPDVNGTVWALALSGSTLHVGGEFTAVGGGTPRDRLAAYTVPSGTLTSWSPGVWGRVLALATKGSTVYVGGSFNAVRGSPAAPTWDTTRTNLVAFDPSGVATFNAITNGNTTRSVRALLVRDDTLFVGGAFSKLGPSTLTPSQRATRWNLGAVDATTGETTPFDPNVGNAVNALALGDGVLYAGGEFLGVNSPSALRKNVAAFDPDGTGTALPFNPTVTAGIVAPYSTNPSPVTALAVRGNSVYVGGDFYFANGEPRASLAAFSADTSALQDWDPGLTGGKLNSLGFRGPWLLVGGLVSAPAGRAAHGAFELTR